MIRNPLFKERHVVHSPAYWREELVRMRDLNAAVNEYGGIDCLLADIGRLEHELSQSSSTYRRPNRSKDEELTDPLWTTHDGKQVRPAEMNSFHLRGALNKLAQQENCDRKLYGALKTELSRRENLAQSTIDLALSPTNH